MGEISSSNVGSNQFVIENWILSSKLDPDCRGLDLVLCLSISLHVHFLHCRTPFLDPRTIYAHLAIFVVTGVAMGFDIGRRRAAVVHAGQLLHLVFLLLTTERVGYRNWVKVSCKFYFVPLRMRTGIYFLTLFETTSLPSIKIHSP